jgi:hypothetical protein
MIQQSQINNQSKITNPKSFNDLVGGAGLEPATPGV